MSSKSIFLKLFFALSNLRLWVIAWLLFLLTLSPISANNMLDRCQAKIIGFVECSKHSFLTSFKQLSHFIGKDRTSIVEELNCLRTEDLGQNDTIFGYNCGLFLGARVKDVSLHFDESGWFFNKTYEFEHISFKLIDGISRFNSILETLNEWDRFNFLKMDNNKIVNCESRNIWIGDVYEYDSLPSMNIALCPNDMDVIQCIIEGHANDPSLEKETTPPGTVCSAKGLIQDSDGSIIGQMNVDFYELRQLPYRNISIWFGNNHY